MWLVRGYIFCFLWLVLIWKQGQNQGSYQLLIKSWSFGDDYDKSYCLASHKSNLQRAVCLPSVHTVDHGLASWAGCCRLRARVVVTYSLPGTVCIFSLPRQSVYSCIGIYSELPSRFQSFTRVLDIILLDTQWFLSHGGLISVRLQFWAILPSLIAISPLSVLILSRISLRNFFVSGFVFHIF